MPNRELNPQDLGVDEEWEGNNAAFKCPVCGKVFIVSDTRMHVGPGGVKGYRQCPGCGKSVRISGGRKSGGQASIEWT
jgi:predicted RNA-binding Zn-ribbon protein involved in translation (DUF1610 family)